MSTRPRISFDSQGWCNACQWMVEKKNIDWESRQKELNVLLNKKYDIIKKIICYNINFNYY